MIKAPELDQIFGDSAKQISATEKKAFIFTSENVPVPPPEISTGHLVLKRGHHDYDGYTIARVDALHFNAEKETYRQLGLCLLSSLFYNEPKKIKIILTHPKSEIKALIFDHKTIAAQVAGFEYSTKLDRFSYCLEIPGRHPLGNATNDNRALPGFRLVNEADVIVTEDDWLNRNVVWGCASAEGDMLFATLLLNISDKAVTENEFVLVSGPGFGNVCAGSPEVTLWLPGSIGWDGD